MASTAEIQTLANRGLMVGLVSFVLTSLIATSVFVAERKSHDVPGWGEVTLCGVCMGVFSVLLYNYGTTWKGFGDSMRVSLIPLALLLVVLGLLLLVGMLVSLVRVGVEAMVLLPPVVLVYYGGAIFLPLAAPLLALSSCVGGAFIYGAMHIMKVASQSGRAQSR